MIYPIEVVMFFLLGSPLLTIRFLSFCYISSYLSCYLSSYLSCYQSSYLSCYLTSYLSSYLSGYLSTYLHLKLPFLLYIIYKHSTYIFDYWNIGRYHKEVKLTQKITLQFLLNKPLPISEKGLPIQKLSF